jgi:hypothetical protein
MLWNYLENKTTEYLENQHEELLLQIINSNYKWIKNICNKQTITTKLLPINKKDNIKTILSDNYDLLQKIEHSCKISNNEDIVGYYKLIKQITPKINISTSTTSISVVGQKLKINEKKHTSNIHYLIRKYTTSIENVNNHI